MWDVLGIEPTNDERAIKRAYAKLLKKNRPDKDPVAFQELRDAYEWCLRATKWTDYDDYDDEDEGQGAADGGFAGDVDGIEFVNVTAEGSAGRAGGSNDDDVSDEALDPFLPPDGPVERIVVRDVDDAVATHSDPSLEAKVGEDGTGRDNSSNRDDWPQTTEEADALLGSRVEASDDGDDEAVPTAFETLVAEFEALLGDSVRARQSIVWESWFGSADEFSLRERQVLRSVIVDLTAIAWCDEPERTEQLLKELPYPAVIGLSDLLGWPHSQVEMSDHIPDDLVLLLGDVLEFDMITDDDRTAFFGPSDPAMVDASMRPDNRRHRNGLIFGPFWCLYRRQFRRTAMVIGGPIIISIATGLLKLAGIQALGVLAFIALFPFYKAGDVRIRWYFVGLAAAVAMVAAFGPMAIAPAFYVMLAAPLHIEAGIKGRQWREAQLQGASAAMPPDIRTDTDRRHGYLSNAGAPSRWAPWLAGALLLIVLTVLVFSTLAIILSK